MRDETHHVGCLVSPGVFNSGACGIALACCYYIIIDLSPTGPGTTANGILFFGVSRYDRYDMILFDCICICIYKSTIPGLNRSEKRSVGRGRTAQVLGFQFS